MAVGPDFPAVSIYIKRFVSLSGVFFCLTPGDKHFSRTGGGEKHFYTQGEGTNIFVSWGGANIFTLRGDKHFHIEGGGTNIFCWRRWWL